MPRDVKLYLKETDGLPELHWTQLEIVPDNLQPSRHPTWVHINKNFNVNTRPKPYLDWQSYPGLALVEFRASLSVEITPNNHALLFSLPDQTRAAQWAEDEDRHVVLFADTVQGFVLESGQRWRSPKLPPFDVILVHGGDGRMEIVAAHYGNPVAMAELRAIMQDAFVTKRPARGWANQLHPAQQPRAAAEPSRRDSTAYDHDDVI